MRETGHGPKNIEDYNSKTPGAEEAGVFEIPEVEFNQNKLKEEIIKKRVSQWANDWLEQLYNNPPTDVLIDGFSTDRYLVQMLDGLTDGQSPDSLDNRIAPVYRTAVETFYERVVDFSEQKITTGEYPNKTQDFIRNINQAFFSISGGTADHMGLAHHLLFTARINRIPELQGQFGQQLTGEMVYKLSFCDDAAVDHLIEQVKERPVAELIDVIEQLKTVGAHFLAYAYSEEEGFGHTVRIIEALRDNSQSPLVLYAAEAALVRMKQEQEEPTYGLVTTHAAATDSRLPERLSQQYIEAHQRLSKQIKSDIPIQHGGILVPISRDTVGMLDHSSMLYAVGRVEAGTLHDAVKVSPQAIENIRDFLKRERRPNSEKLRDLLGVTIQTVLAPREGKEFIPVEDLPEIFHKISPALTVEEYKQLFSQIVSREHWEDEQRNYQDRITQEAEVKNLKISDNFLQQYEKLSQTLITADSQKFKWVEDKLQQYYQHKKSGETDLAFKRAEESAGTLESGLRMELAELAFNNVFNQSLSDLENLPNTKDFKVIKEKTVSFKSSFAANNRHESYVLACQAMDLLRNLEILHLYPKLQTLSDYLVNLVNVAHQVLLNEDAIAKLKAGQWSPETIQAVAQLIKAAEDLRAGYQATWKDWEEKKNNHFYDNGSQKVIAQMSAYSETMWRFAKHYPQFSRHLNRYLKQIEQEQSSQLTAVHFTRVKELINDKEVMPFAAKDAQEVPMLLADLHRPALRDRVEQDLGVSLADLSLSSQIHFLRFLAGQNTEGYERLKEVLGKCQEFRVEFLNAFLVVSEDTSYGGHLLALAERLSDKPDVAKRVFDACNDFVGRAQGKALDVLKDLQAEFPDLELTEDMITQALISRGRDFLTEFNQQAESGKPLPKLVNEFVAELTNFSFKQQVVRKQFKSLAELLNREKIDLSQFERQQTVVLASVLKDPESRSLMLSTLSRMGKLEPIPEIHWRVDRNTEEYNRRFGLDLVAFLKEKAGTKAHQKLLEIGPGSGVSARQREEAGLGKNYIQMSLSDKIYYPLAPVIEKLIDFSKLEENTKVTLSPEDRKLLADFIYKTIVIEPGQTERDNFDYDGQNMTYLQRDINVLKKILPEVGNYFHSVKTVPSHISSRDEHGQVDYPYKIRASEQSSEFQLAKQSIAQNLVGYLRKDWEEIDYYSLIEAFPPNVMIGDITDVRRFLPDQIDVELGVRSTVYKRGEEYIRFLTTLLSRLSDGGVAIDDSLRDNDGWYYRIAEVWEANKRAQGMNPEVLVVLGPGFEGEDVRQDLVPLAMLVTKNGSSRKLAEKYLQQGYQLVSLEELAKNSEYLKTLDKTGWTSQCCQKAVALESIII